MTYREIAETFQDLIWHQLQTMLDSSHEGAAWAYPRPRSASLSMSNQIPGQAQGHPNKRMGDRRCRLGAADRQLVIYKSGLWSRFWPIRAPAKKQSSTAFLFHHPSMSTPFAALRGATVLRAATPARCGLLP